MFNKTLKSKGFQSNHFAVTTLLDVGGLTSSNDLSKLDRQYIFSRKDTDSTKPQLTTNSSKTNATILQKYIYDGDLCYYTYNLKLIPNELQLVFQPFISYDFHGIHYPDVTYYYNPQVAGNTGYKLGNRRFISGIRCIPIDTLVALIRYFDIIKRIVGHDDMMDTTGSLHNYESKHCSSLGENVPEADEFYKLFEANHLNLANFSEKLITAIRQSPTLPFILIPDYFKFTSFQVYMNGEFVGVQDVSIHDMLTIISKCLEYGFKRTCFPDKIISHSGQEVQSDSNPVNSKDKLISIISADDSFEIMSDYDALLVSTFKYDYSNLFLKGIIDQVVSYLKIKPDGIICSVMMPFFKKWEVYDEDQDLESLVLNVSNCSIGGGQSSDLLCSLGISILSKAFRSKFINVDLYSLDLYINHNINGSDTSPDSYKFNNYRLCGNEDKDVKYFITSIENKRSSIGDIMYRIGNRVGIPDNEWSTHFVGGEAFSTLVSKFYTRFIYDRSVCKHIRINKVDNSNMKQLVLSTVKFGFNKKLGDIEKVYLMLIKPHFNIKIDGKFDTLHNLQFRVDSGICETKICNIVSGLYMLFYTRIDNFANRSIVLVGQLDCHVDWILHNLHDKAYFSGDIIFDSSQNYMTTGNISIIMIDGCYYSYDNIIDKHSGQSIINFDSIYFLQTFQ